MQRRTFTNSMMVLTMALGAVFGTSALAQTKTIKIGEVNSYKAQPAFLDPYKKGMDLAVEEVNAAGGVLGRKFELITRDDGASPGDAVRVADAPRPNEIVFILAMTSGGRVHERMGGMKMGEISKYDGQR